jgi:hypothetical protein
MLLGRPNKAMAIDLGITCHTIEVYRARLMLKMQARELLRPGAHGGYGEWELVGDFRCLDRGPQGRAEKPRFHDTPLIVEARPLRSPIRSIRRKSAIGIPSRLRKEDGESGVGARAVAALLGCRI